MGYTDDNLASGERVEYRANVHWVVFAPAIFLGVVAIWMFVVAASNPEASFAGGMGGFFLVCAIIAERRANTARLWHRAATAR